MKTKIWVRTAENPQYKGTGHWHFMGLVPPNGHKMQAGDTYTYGNSKYVLDKVEYKYPTIHYYWTETKIEGKYDPIGRFKKAKKTS